MKRITSVTLLLSIVFFTSLLSAAQNDSEILVVRGNGSYPPNEMVENGELTGLHIDIVKAVARELNMTVKFKSVPWNRALNLVKKGTADAVSYASRTSEREAYAHFEEGNTFSITSNAFMVSAENASKIKYSGAAYAEPGNFAFER